MDHDGTTYRPAILPIGQHKDGQQEVDIQFNDSNQSLGQSQKNSGKDMMALFGSTVDSAPLVHTISNSCDYKDIAPFSVSSPNSDDAYFAHAPTNTCLPLSTTNIDGSSVSSWSDQDKERTLYTDQLGEKNELSLKMADSCSSSERQTDATPQQMTSEGPPFDFKIKDHKEGLEINELEENDKTSYSDQLTGKNEQTLQMLTDSCSFLEKDNVTPQQNHRDEPLSDHKINDLKEELETNELEDQYSNIGSSEHEQDSINFHKEEQFPNKNDLRTNSECVPARVLSESLETEAEVVKDVHVFCENPVQAKGLYGNLENNTGMDTTNEASKMTDKCTEETIAAVISCAEKGSISQSPQTETTDSGFDDGFKKNLDDCLSHCDDSIEHSSFDFLQTCLEKSENDMTFGFNLTTSTSPEKNKAIKSGKPDQIPIEQSNASEDLPKSNKQEVSEVDKAALLNYHDRQAKVSTPDGDKSRNVMANEEDRLMEIEACSDENNDNYPAKQRCLVGSHTMKRRFDPVVVIDVKKPDNYQSQSHCCASCGEHFADNDGLIEHFHLQHSKSSFQQCLTCRRYLTNDEAAEEHHCDKPEEPLKTKHKSESSQQISVLYRCTLCPLRFKNRDVFEKHQLKHKPSTHYKCQNCGCCFSGSSGLSKHIMFRRCPVLKAARKKEKSASIGKKTKTYDISHNPLPNCFVKLVDINSVKHAKSPTSCNVCNKSFAFNMQYVMHMRTHSTEKPFKCKDCNLAFKYSWNLDRHRKEKCDKIKTHTDKQHANVHTKKTISRGSAPQTNPKSASTGTARYTCPLCPRLFNSSQYLSRHMRMQCLKEYTKINGKGKTTSGYKCPLCSNVYTLASNLRRHLKASCFQNYKSEEFPKLKKESQSQAHKSKSKAFHKCKLCPAVFSHISGLAKHSKKHRLFAKTGIPVKYRTSNPALLKQSIQVIKHEDETTEKAKSESFSRQIGGKSFAKPVSSKKHISTKKGIEPYSCVQCGKRFRLRSLLIAHGHTHKRRVKCSVCKKIFSSIAEFLKHRQVHDGKAMILCEHCPIEFQFPVFYIRHMAMHESKDKKNSTKQNKKDAQPPEPLKQHDPSGSTAEFRCRLCHKSFVSAKAFGDHCLTHLPAQSSLTCQFCKRRCASRASLVRHIRLHTGERPFPCRKCGKYFRRKEGVEVHLATCTGKGTVKENANATATVKNKPEPRIVVKNTKKHKCPQCPQVFLWNRSLTKHLNGHKLKLLAPCSKCGRCFHKKLLDQHEKTCNGKVPSTITLFPCSKCRKAFGRIYNKNIHEAKCTGSASQEIVQKTSEGIRAGLSDRLPFKCSHCPKSFKYRSYYLKHLPTHKTGKPYICMHCGHEYASQQRCFQHEAFCDGIFRRRSVSLEVMKREPLEMNSNDRQSQNENDDKYKCKFCTKAFSKARNLRRHILTHTDVKPYRCKTCDSCFSRYDHLKVHQSRCKEFKRKPEVSLQKISLKQLGTGWKKSEQRKKVFRCTSCSKEFKNESDLKRHTSLSHGSNKPFKCQRCQSSFTLKSSLAKHKLHVRCKQVLQNHKAKIVNAKATKLHSSKMVKSLERIQAKYSKKFKFQCAYCPRHFKDRGSLNTHTRLHTGEKPFGCENCGERFIRRDYLQRHLVKCTANREASENILCDTCGSSIPQDSYDHHKISCTAKSKQNVPTVKTQSTSPPKIRTFSCTKCSQKFLLFSQLQQHFLNAHRQDGSQNLCEDRFATKDSFGIEIDVSGCENTESDPKSEKLYPCPHCGMRFQNRGGLAMHIRTHTMVYPLSCKKCGKGFWTKNVQKRHLRKCVISGNDFTTTGYLEPLCEDKDSVLLFNTSTNETGAGVLQTTFSCKNDKEPSKDSGSNSIQNNTTAKGQVVAKKYQCSECDMSFTDGLMLISHLENHGRDDVLKYKGKCAACGKNFDTLQGLSRHMMVTHGKQLQNICPLCQKCFRSSGDLQSHLSLHDPSRPFSCSLCTCRYLNKRALSIHISAAHPDQRIKDFICHPCKITYSTLNSLRRHNRKHHPNASEHGQDETPATDFAESVPVNEDTDSSEVNEEIGSDDDSDSAPYFPCHVCGKTFPTSEGLEDHQRCHLGEKPHECEECGKCFFQLVNLQQHQRSHKSEFQCQTCGRGFVSLFALKKHKHSHGKSRPHRCSKCHLSFTGPSQLAEHMATHQDENFPCDLCDRTFSCKLSRAEHRKTHNVQEEELLPLIQPLRTQPLTSAPTMPSTSGGEKGQGGPFRYRCIICSMRFRDSEQLSEHGCKASKDRPYKCTECDKHFLLGSHLKKHQLTHQPSGTYRYQCNQCHMNFNYRHHFLSHLRRHGTEKESEVSGDQEGLPAASLDPDNIYQCPICPNSYSQAMELANHLTEHSFMCRLCSMTFPTKSQLTEHEQCHLTATTQYECTECGETFFGSEAFRQHQCAKQQHVSTENVPGLQSSSLASPPKKSKSLGHDEEEDVDVGEDFYNCLSCKRRFSSKTDLAEHHKKHPECRPFKCQVCGKGFAKRRYLYKHGLIHKKEFQCSECPQTFYDETSLNKHRETHKRRLFQCSHCDASYPSAQQLERHERKHAKQDRMAGTHRCDMCYKSFGHLSLLRKHQETHVGEVVYECTECDKAFAFFHLLEEHQRTHEGDSAAAYHVQD